MTSAVALLLVLFCGLRGQALAQEGPCGAEGKMWQEEAHLNSAAWHHSFSL